VLPRPLTGFDGVQLLTEGKEMEGIGRGGEGKEMKKWGRKEGGRNGGCVMAFGPFGG